MTGFCSMIRSIKSRLTGKSEKRLQDALLISEAQRLQRANALDTSRASTEHLRRGLVSLANALGTENKS